MSSAVSRPSLSPKWLSRSVRTSIQLKPSNWPTVSALSDDSTMPFNVQAVSRLPRFKSCRTHGERRYRERGRPAPGDSKAAAHGAGRAGDQGRSETGTRAGATAGEPHPNGEGGLRWLETGLLGITYRILFESRGQFVGVSGASRRDALNGRDCIVSGGSGSDFAEEPAARVQSRPRRL
jgi:hypothetical protein